MTDCPVSHFIVREGGAIIDGDQFIHSIAVENLPNITKRLELQEGIENSLVSKIKNAMKSLEKGNLKAAINQFKTFINEVEAYSGKKIPVEVADMIIACFCCHTRIQFDLQDLCLSKRTIRKTITLMATIKIKCFTGDSSIK